MAKTTCLTCDRCYPENDPRCPGCGNTLNEQLARSRLEISRMQSGIERLQGFRDGLRAGFEISAEIIRNIQ